MKLALVNIAMVAAKVMVQNEDGVWDDNVDIKSVWDGYKEAHRDTYCGMQYKKPEGHSMLNSTCTITIGDTATAKGVWPLDGAFIVGQDGNNYQVTGLADQSGALEFIVEFEQPDPEGGTGEKSNLTCWEVVSYDCDDDGAPNTDVMFMGTFNNHDSGPGYYTVRVGNHDSFSTLTMIFRDHAGNPLNIHNATCMDDDLCFEHEFPSDNSIMYTRSAEFDPTLNENTHDVVFFFDDVPDLFQSEVVGA